MIHCEEVQDIVYLDHSRKSTEKSYDTGDELTTIKDIPHPCAANQVIWVSYSSFKRLSVSILQEI